MRHRANILRPLLALSMGLPSTAPLAHSPQATPLAGLWKLNSDLSERFEDKIEAARRPGAYTGAAGGRPRGGGAGRQGGAGRVPREPGERWQEGQEMANLMHPVLQVLIRQDDSTVSISDAAGQMQTFHTDGRKEKEPLLTGADLETSAKWKDGKLTIERKQDKAGTLKETYDVDPASKRMILIIKLNTPTLVRSLEFRRIYDPAPSPGN